MTDTIGAHDWAALLENCQTLRLAILSVDTPAGMGKFLLDILQGDSAVAQQVALVVKTRAKASDWAAQEIMARPAYALRLLKMYFEGEALHRGGVVSDARMCAELVACCEEAFQFQLDLQDASSPTSTVLRSFAAGPQ